jgi:hypothetical protein
VKPALVRRESTEGASASENAFSGPGGGLAPSASWIAVAHSFRSRLCHTIMTRRPPGSAAPAMFLNAASGSAKNMVPNRLMTRSKLAAGNGWTCASPRS